MRQAMRPCVVAMGLAFAASSVACSGGSGGAGAAPLGVEPSSAVGLEAVTPTPANVLVVAPHPDDDIITSAGVMLRARRAGETVHVMYMTNGDIDGLTTGLLREDESVRAVSFLSVAESSCIFLGYPDGGLADLRGAYAGSDTALTGNSGLNHTYGDRGLGQMDYHRYAFGASALNNGANVKMDVASVLSTFRPTDIFVTSEFDQHPDHVATYRFLMDGLAAVTASDPTYNPTVHRTIVWWSSGPWPLPADPTAYNTEPPNLLSSTGLVWSKRESLDVPLAAQTTNLTSNLKWLAIDAEASQGGNSGYIGGFLHKDEWFFGARAQGTNRPPVPNAGLDRTVAAGASVQLDGTGSVDPDGTALTYQWRQTDGPSVKLSSTTVAQPSFVVPASAAPQTVFAFELAVSDGVSTSVGDGVSVIVGTCAGCTNLALSATATASSQATGQEARKVDDGYTDGYPTNYTHEWASVGQGAGAWVQLTWPTAQTIDQVVLYDRPNLDDRVMAGTLSFSSGANVPVGALDNAGEPMAVAVSSRSVTWVRFTITQVASTTHNIGLAEMQLFASGAVPINQPPVANAGADQTVAQGATVTLNGSGTDPEGAPVTYSWTQTLGPPVLTVTNVPSPTFVAPSGLTTNVTLSFLLVVSDGVSSSAPSTTSVTVLAPAPPPPPQGTNLALSATATASTQATGQEARKVDDGYTDGYPTNYTHEWASVGQGVGAWVQLTWTTAQTIEQVVLFDRPNLNDRVMAGTLSFSSGASVPVGALDNAGAPMAVAVSSRSVTWVRFTVTQVASATYNIGLAEMQVFAAGGTPVNQPPVADAGADQTAAQGATVTLNGSGTDPEGAPLTYAWTQTQGPPVLTTTNVATATFVAPSGATTNVTLTFELVVSDGVSSSAPSTTSVTVLAQAPPPSGGNLALSATVTASSQAPGQEAGKVIDGYTDGYPTNYTHEWASAGQGAGAWVQLTWATPQAVDSVTLYDRPNLDDNVLSGTLTFSDGSSVAVGVLTNSGGPVSVPFGARTVTWVRFTVTSVSANTYNIGLAELQVY